jgi:nucleoside-diphosphate kinase
MIKPDAVAAKNSGKIIDMIELNGFEIMRMHKVLLTEDIAQVFYAIHRSKPFFNELVEFVTSGPVIIMALSKTGAVSAFRNFIGETDPKKAEQGTVRNLFGTDIAHNAVHGSDSDENAKLELSTFFADEMDEEEGGIAEYSEEDYDIDDEDDDENEE